MHKVPTSISNVITNITTTIGMNSQLGSRTTSFSVSGGRTPILLTSQVSDSTIVNTVSFDVLANQNAVGTRTVTITSGTSTGVCTVTITATDNISRQYSTTFTVTINPVASIGSISNESMNISSVLSLVFLTNGGTGALSASVSSSDSTKVSATVVSGTTMTLTSTNVAGSTTITLSVTDAVGVQSPSVTFVVTTIDPCSSTPCYHGSQCQALTQGAFSCTCTSGYEGALCNVDINGCLGVTCFSGVNCIDAAAPQTGYRCGLCPTGYVGNGSVCVTGSGSNLVSTIYSVTVGLSIDISTITNQTAFMQQTTNDFCTYLHALGIMIICEHVYVVSINQGSVILNVYILPDTYQIQAANALLNGFSNNDPALTSLSSISSIVFQGSGITSQQIPNNSTSMIVTGVAADLGLNIAVVNVYVNSIMVVGYTVSGGTGAVAVTTSISDSSVVSAVTVKYNGVLNVYTGSSSGTAVVNVTATDSTNIANFQRFIVNAYSKLICQHFCFVLFCFVLFCLVLFCFVLFLFCFCFVFVLFLFCFVLFCFVLFCFVLFCFVLFFVVLFCFVFS